MPRRPFEIVLSSSARSGLSFCKFTDFSPNLFFDGLAGFELKSEQLKRNVVHGRSLFILVFMLFGRV